MPDDLLHLNALQLAKVLLALLDHRPFPDVYVRVGSALRPVNAAYVSEGRVVLEVGDAEGPNAR